ncbi:MAG: thioredoxin-dependent thiol peroxidase, partial [Thermoanaerobaculia bacterium]
MSEEFKASQPLTAGSTAPDFTLLARSGKMVSLRDFAGHKDVLIYFYPKDDTPGCTREACSLRDGWADLAKAGIEVLGISRDDAASHSAFAAKYNLPFELLTDADHSVHERYGAWGQNPNPAWGVGPLRKSFLVGKDGKVRRVFDKVDTEHHAEQVLRSVGLTPPSKPAPAPMATP